MEEKITVETLKQIQESQHNYTDVNINGAGKTPINMRVARSIPLDSFLQFVKSMSNSQWLDDEFVPSYGEIQFDIELVQRYTNVELPTVNVDDESLIDSTAAYNMIHSLGLKDKVLSVIDESEQYKSLLECIYDAQTHEMTRRTGIYGIITKIKGFVDSLDTKGVS